jgi:hypothetical protein
MLTHAEECRYTGALASIGRAEKLLARRLSSAPAGKKKKYRGVQLV